MGNQESSYRNNNRSTSYQQQDRYSGSSRNHPPYNNGQQRPPYNSGYRNDAPNTQRRPIPKPSGRGGFKTASILGKKVIVTLSEEGADRMPFTAQKGDVLEGKILFYKFEADESFVVIQTMPQNIIVQVSIFDNSVEVLRHNPNDQPI